MRHSLRLGPGRAGAVAVFALALVSRGLWLGRPSVLVFDEIFYASDAMDLLVRGVEGGNPVHPPLGKWMIALGIKTLGFTPWGWRVVPLLAGAAVASLTWALAWRLTRRRGLAALATSFVLFDGVSVVTGRLAILDGLVAIWVLIAVALLLRMLDRPTAVGVRLLAGAAIGAAIATKWHAVMLLPVGFVLTLFLDDHLRGRQKLAATVRSVVAFALVPAAVYVLAHVGFWVNVDETRVYAEACEESADCDTGPADRVQLFVRAQLETQEFHRNLDPQHPDVASAWTWPVQSDPVKFYVRDCRTVGATGTEDGTCSRGSGEARILALGNPVVWLLGTIATVAGFGLAVWTRDRHLLLITVTVGALWVPWLAGSRPGYTFYGAALVPLFGLAAGRLLDHLPDRRWLWVTPSVVVAAAGVALWPLWIGAEIPAGVADMLLRMRLA